ncbi:hypothetical protein O181_038782 [Austropuccinia psidii MF-1]|uniref:Uncharacterized protein n=1 Tax=Austropuccinia psidii MF-1 TaxID=1389203 RepID=A0A9Q3DFF3_9BASI|nr:hypothetical protein [Austropuccinia psidii MF-1]
MTEITESSPSVPPQSVLCGSGILSQLASLWPMASSGHFDPAQTYYGYKVVEVLDPACTNCLAKEKYFFQNSNLRPSKCHFFVWKKPCCGTGPPDSNFRRYLWSKKDGHFGKECYQLLRPLPLMVPQSTLMVSLRDVARWANVEGTIYSSSEVPISSINTEVVVKRIRQIANSPPDPDAEGSD